MDRHRNMEETHAVDSSGPRSAQRSHGRACIHCRQRKIRCDILKGAPCTNCRAHGRPGCQVYEAKKRRNQAGGSSKNRPLRPLQSRRNAEPGVPEAARTLATATPALDAQKTSDPTQDLRPLPMDSSTEEKHEGNMADFFDREDLRLSELNHVARNCYIGTEASNFNYLVRQGSVKTIHNDCFHFANRQFSLRHTSYDLSRMPPEALLRPDKALEEKLLRVYFEHINRGWPIIDERCFMTSYRGQDPLIPLQMPLLNAICLVAAHVLAPHDVAMKSLKADFFRRAKMLLDHRVEQDRTSYIQTALLLAWCSDGVEEIVANAWHWIGTACRTALGMGMHRNCMPSRLLDGTKRTWIRLWWVLFQYDTMVSCAYGRQQALNLDESDTPDLEPSHFQGLPQVEVDFAIQHTRLCVIISKTLKKRWALRSTVASQIKATQEADEALAQFLTQLPPKLKATSSQASIWQATLHLTYNNFLMLLHRPPPKQTIDGPLKVMSDATICGDAACVMTSMFEILLSQKSLSQLWLYGIHTLFTVMIHATNSLNSSNAVVATKAFRRFDTLLAALRELSHHWQFAFSILALFEKRLSRAKQHGIGSSAKAPQVTDNREASPEFVLRPVPTATADMPVSHPGYDEAHLGGSGELPPLDDIMFNNLAFPEDSILNDLLVGLNWTDPTLEFQ